MSVVNEELGFYALAGQPKSPRDLLDELRQGEALGLGTAFLSERYNQKEICTLCGAAGAVTETIRLATAATNHNTRHPIVTAGFALTMHGLTGGRFVLGIGRGIVAMQKAYGIPTITTAQMEDFVGLTRRLLRGGRCFDEVVLHTYVTDETTERAVKTVKRAAEQAGRDPADVKVWSCFATIGDHIPEERRLMKSVGRLATYLQGYGELLVDTNGWDRAVLERFRADELVSTFRGVAPCRITPSQPSSSWCRMASTHCSGLPVAECESHSSGISVAMCSSCSGVAFTSIVLSGSNESSTSISKVSSPVRPSDCQVCPLTNCSGKTPMPTRLLR